MSEVEIKQKQVPVSKEADELAEAVSDLALDMVKQAEDGVQFTDIPAAVTPNLQKLYTGLEGSSKLGAEATLEPGAFMNAWTSAGAKVLDALVKRNRAASAKAEEVAVAEAPVEATEVAAAEPPKEESAPAAEASESAPA